LRLQGRRALVTAAGQGIGRAICEAFVREGAQVVAVDRAPLAYDGPERSVVLDLTDAAEVDALGDDVGPVDVLVNAAGIVHDGDVMACGVDDLDAAWALNVAAMYRTIRTFLPAMVTRGRGSIVNISSVASSIIGVRNRFAYGTTKAAVIGLTKSVAADYVATGVRCNAICPGTVETPSLLERVRALAEREGLSFEEAHAAFAARQPVGRLGRADEIAALAVHLASDESAFTTGTTAVIDGGWTLL